MEVRPLTPAIGAEIKGVSIDDGLDGETFGELRRVWCERGVVVLRGQNLDRLALQRFSQYFGPLEAPPASERSARAGAGADDAPNVWLISNVIEDGKPIGSLGAGEAEWHTDMAYLAEPPTASLLYGLEVPESGANTCFASMAAAYDKLPAKLQTALEGRRAKHSGAYTSAGELRQGADAVADVTSAPGVEHPVIRRHPETGRKSVFLGRRRNGYIVGMELAQSEALLDETWAFTTQAEFVYEHVWQAGDLLIWDNRSVVHRRDAFDPTARRVLMRTQVKGDRPY